MELKMEEDSVEMLAVALVREYLSRKGYKQSLCVFDKESQKKDYSIQNRKVLAEKLTIIDLVRKNKKEGCLYRCFLEMIINNIKEKDSLNNSLHNRSSLDISENIMQYSRTDRSDASLTPRLSEVDLNDSMASNTSAVFSPTSSPTKIPVLSESNLLHRRASSLTDLSSNNLLHKDLNGNHVARKTRIPNRIVAGEKCVQAQRKFKPTRIPDANSTPAKMNGHTSQNDNKQDSFIESLRKQKQIKSSLVQKQPELVTTRQSFTSSVSPTTSKRQFGDLTMADFNSTDFDASLNPHHPKKSNESFSVNKPLVTTKITSEPISMEVAINLKEILFGSALLGFNDEWKQQGFIFHDHPHLLYGLTQEKGGPCGLLAAVQAHVLRHWLFPKEIPSSKVDLTQPTKTERDTLLIKALTEIFILVQKQPTVVVALPTPTSKIPTSSSSSKFKGDKLTEYLQLFHLPTTTDSVYDFLQKNLHHFKKPKGCILFLYSVLLTYGFDHIRSSIDEVNTPLMGRHGYCTQEMVNLLLTGESVSNVFDDNVNLDQKILKGLSKRNDIGFLSLFEHYDSCKVGQYYKNPVYPIWVVCSESHFSVMFSSEEIDGKHRNQFDLYYYDGLARQDEEIRLTVTLRASARRQSTPGRLDLIPPLEHCIRTKWKGAVVSWNGTDPIL